MKTPIRYGFRLQDIHLDNKTLATFVFDTYKEQQEFVQRMAKVIENPKRYHAKAFEEYKLS